MVGWSDAETKRLRDLWKRGDSLGTIAHELRTSKNAVVGKAHRLDLPNRPRPQNLKQPRLTKPAARPVVPKPPAGPPPQLGSVRLCQWPIGDPRTKAFRLCSNPLSELGCVYCPEHHALAHQRRN